MSADRIYRFVGGQAGGWLVQTQTTLAGQPLPHAARVKVCAVDSPAAPPAPALWTLTGARSNERYVNRPEHDQLAERQEGLGRPTATLAALIPIRKSAQWWALTQDERREIFEEQSGHISRSLKYLPAIARRLHHSRDLAEPFDFLTWFEFAPEHNAAFNELLDMLRASPEWAYVDCEIDIRLERAVS